MGRTIILIGASGLVGNELLHQLSEDPDVSQVKIVVRRPMDIMHPKIKQLVVNFDHFEDNRSEITGDTVMCCLGTTIRTAGSKAFRKVDHEYVLQFATIAKENGVSCFVLVSSIGANKDGSNFYLKVKGEIEAAISKLGFGLFVIVRPSMLMGKRKEQRVGEQIGKIVMRTLGFLFVGRLKKYRAIEAHDVAKAMIVLSKKNIDGISIIESDVLQRLAN